MSAPALRAGAAMAAFILALPIGAADAAETLEPSVRDAQVRDSARRAAVWSLGAEDWSRYEELMRGRRGAWSPGADPLLVLGAHARTVDERRRFAEAFVMAEHTRVEGELAFERAVQAAWRRLFPERPRLAASAGPDAAVERYALVLDRGCADCGRRVGERLGLGVPVDVYLRGAADDADVRAWAGEQGIDPAAVGAGRVTLNRGDAAPAGASPGVWARLKGRGWSPVE